MAQNPLFHLIYRPANARDRLHDELIAFLKTYQTENVVAAAALDPEAIALALEAADDDEAAQELHDLGF